MEQQRGPHLPHDVLGAHDALRSGLPTLKADALPAHPAEVIEETNRKYHMQTRRFLMEKAYGTALPLQMQMERQILSKFQRPPGLIPSSMLGLESLTGALDEIGFEDSFGDVRESESFVPVDMHHAMEVRLGLSRGPVSRSFF
jgi:proteasome maturation protein